MLGSGCSGKRAGGQRLGKAVSPQSPAPAFLENSTPVRVGVAAAALKMAPRPGPVILMALDPNCKQAQMGTIFKQNYNPRMESGGVGVKCYQF